MPTACELKYLFVARYADGSVFHQPPEDVSRRDPKRSAYYDVVQDQAEGKIIESFFLLGEGHTFAVDLRDGHFEIDGRVVWLGDCDPPARVAKLALVFFRQHSHDFVMGSDGHVVFDTDGKAIETDHRIRYCLGWEALVDGKPVRQVLGVF